MGVRTPGRRAGPAVILAAALLLVAAALPAFGQAPVTEGAWVLQRPDGKVWIVGTFGRSLTSGNAAVFSYSGEDGGISVYLDLGDEPASSFVPDPQPGTTYSVEWYAPEDPGDWALLLFPAESGGLLGVGLEIDSDFYRTLGEFIDFEAGTGFEPPGETVKYDGLQSVNIEKLEEALGSISIAPSRLALSGAKGEGELAVDVEETTTTTTTTTIAPTTAAGSEPTAAAAGSEETPGTAGEEGGWGIGVWIIFGAVVLAAAIFFGGKVVRRPSSIPGLDEIPDIPDDIPGPFDAQRTGRDQSGQQFVGGSETDLDYDPESGWKRDSGSYGGIGGSGSDPGSYGGSGSDPGSSSGSDPGSYGGIGGSGSYEPSAPRDAFGESPADGGFVEPDDEVVATDEGNLPEPEPMEAEPVDPAPNGEEGDEPDDGEFKETIL